MFWEKDAARLAATSSTALSSVWQWLHLSCHAAGSSLWWWFVVAICEKAEFRRHTTGPKRVTQTAPTSGTRKQTQVLCAGEVFYCCMRNREYAMCDVGMRSGYCGTQCLGTCLLLLLLPSPPTPTQEDRQDRKDGPAWRSSGRSPDAGGGPPEPAARVGCKPSLAAPHVPRCQSH